MDWSAILENLFVVVIIPLLGLITKYIVSFLSTKTEEIKDQTQNELLKKYLDMLNSTVVNCVIATNQTYVDNLKGQKAFTVEAQKAALEKTKTAVMTILSTEAKDYLINSLGDLETYVMNLIEAQVNVNKSVQN